MKDNALAAASMAFGVVRDIADGLDIPYVKGIAALALIITDGVQVRLGR